MLNFEIANECLILVGEAGDCVTSGFCAYFHIRIIGRDCLDIGVAGLVIFYSY